MKKHLNKGSKKCYNEYVIKKKKKKERHGRNAVRVNEMAKRKVTVNKVVVDKNAAQFMRTAANLARKGKTNKKLHGRNANPKAAKYAI
jgi:hypothetical protein